MSKINLQWEPRPQQVQIEKTFRETLKNKKKFFFVDAPVGIGKSYAIIMMARAYQEMNNNYEAKFDVVTNTKILQNQYLNDFEQMVSIKGTENYHCKEFNSTCSEGSALSAAKGYSKRCMPCSYKVARKEYILSDLGVLNFHMFITYWNYSSEMMGERNAKILFVDEAHSFEETYCGFINAELSKKVLAELDVWLPSWEEKMLTIRRVDQFATFLKDEVFCRLEQKSAELFKMLKDPVLSDFEKISVAKEHRNLNLHISQYKRLIDDEDDWRTNWTIQIDKSKAEWSWRVEAVWSKKYIKELWSKYDQVVFLSGTILDKNFFMDLMGCDESESEYLTMDSPFPVVNRMIVYLGVDKLSYRRKEQAFKNMVPEIAHILAQHSKEKGIIHTANYELSRWIERDVKNDRLLFHDKWSRKKTLDEHYSQKSPTVLVSPSMINGVDLKGDLSRFQVILKVPYPNMSSLRVKERMRSNDKWYSWKTLCDIIQSYGRSIRSEDDFAVTYILDENFSNLIDRVKLPSYLSDALVER